MPRDDLIILRNGTAAEWASANPTLADGEPGAETDTGVIKIGDGSTAWSGLPVPGGGGEIDAVLAYTLGISAQTPQADGTIIFDAMPAGLTQLAGVISGAEEGTYLIAGGVNMAEVLNGYFRATCWTGSLWTGDVLTAVTGLGLPGFGLPSFLRIEPGNTMQWQLTSNDTADIQNGQVRMYRLESA